MFKNQEIENNLENNTEFLLSDLSREIAEEFSLSQKESQELVNSSNIDTRYELEAKLNSFQIKWENIISKKEEILERLLLMIIEARKQIEESKKSQEVLVKNESTFSIAELQKNLELKQKPQSLTENDIKISFIENKLPTKMVLAFKTPTNFHEHLGWLCLWIANSSEACLKVSKDILFWIVKTPLDIYSIFFKRDAIYTKNV